MACLVSFSISNLHSEITNLTVSSYYFSDVLPFTEWWWWFWSFPLVIHLATRLFFELEPRPFRSRVFDDPLYSQSRTHAAPRVVEVLETSYSDATDASGTDEFEVSSKSSVHIVGPSRER